MNNTCGNCGFSFTPQPPQGQPAGLYCQVNPPQYGGHITPFTSEQVQVQTIFVDAPVRPERIGCRFHKPKGGKKK